ncbi:hypothetical protein Y032_0095g2852 [Ancylostoma ceylanicum]|uniref:Uncharacterized protein n=1 Tax=Ancylostoma ceylanicum TaxID=53326 RepID=A0A016TKR3_9BILA|nr:hypothetical protein Y032_0095g2852 [Ancylostoma ceylanicum]
MSITYDGRLPLLIASFFLASFTAYYFSSRFSAKEEVKSPEQTMEEILLHSFPSKIVERICSNFTGACFTLVDKMEKKRGRFTVLENRSRLQAASISRTPRKGYRPAHLRRSPTDT